MQLKELLIDVFKKSELKDPRIELEELPTGTVFGRITSPTFTGKSLSQNTSFIGDIINANIPEHERRKITEIIPITPEQQDVMDEFEREETLPDGNKDTA